ncbi:hypothetical protein Tco_0359472 [Tanacetum coccineum]
MGVLLLLISDQNNHPVETKEPTHKPGRQMYRDKGFLSVLLNSSAGTYVNCKGKTRSLVTKKTDISYVRSSRNLNLMNMLQMMSVHISSGLVLHLDVVWTKQFKASFFILMTFEQNGSNLIRWAEENILHMNLQDEMTDILHCLRTGIHCISKFPSIYIQLFWNTLTHDAKTGRSLLHDNIIPKPDLALELGKSISLTEAEEEALIRRENQCFIVLLSGALFQPHRRRDILSFMSITKRVFKGVEIFDQRGTYWYDKYDNSSSYTVSDRKKMYIGTVLFRRYEPTQERLMIHEEARLLPKGEYRGGTTDCLHGTNGLFHFGSGCQQKDRKPSQNDKTEHGMEKTMQAQDASRSLKSSA